MKHRWLSPTSGLRTVVDLAWVAAFAAVMLVMFLGARQGSPVGPSMQLSLIEGTQQRGFYRHGRRLGGTEHRAERTKQGWVLTERFFAGVEASEQKAVGLARLHLRRDLSLDRLNVHVQLARLADLTGLGGGLAARLGVGELRLEGHCAFRSGVCDIEGSIGKRPINRSVRAGKGPMLPSAIYPLLARGVLGKKVELALVDPMTMQRRQIVYTTMGRRELRLRGIAHQAVLVRQEVAGLTTQLWLDRQGRLLREQLPLGIWIEHESWSEDT